MNTAPSRIGIVIGTTREGRFGEIPARWMLDFAAARTDIVPEVIDLRDYPLPFYGMTSSDAAGADDAAMRWREKLAALDGLVFTVAEYNHGVSAVLKNALDHAYAEFGRKPAAFVGYGGVGGARAVEQLRLVCIELRMAPIGPVVHIGGEAFVALTSGGDFANFPHLGAAAAVMLDDIAWWAAILKAGRDADARLQQEEPEAA